MCVGEEDAVVHVAALGNGAQRRGTLKTAVDAAGAVPAQGAGRALTNGLRSAPSRVWVVMRRCERRARVSRWPDLIAETPCRTGAADHPRLVLTGRSRVVKT